MTMLAVVTLFVMACLARSQDCIGETATDSNCASNSEGAVKGSAMLQVRQSSSLTPSACSMERAKEEPLTENGFQTVSKSCCYEDIKTFMSRVIDDMGLKVCDAGGLSGISPFYSCPPYPVSLAQLKEDLNKALQTANSKCHWLSNRYEECIKPALECGVSVQKPPPYPKPVASGFMAFKVANPAEMMRTNTAIDVMQNDIALQLGLDTSYVNVVIGSGPLDGEEVTSSLFQVPKIWLSTQLKALQSCKVFAAYSIQENAPQDPYGATPAPTLDEADVVNNLKHFDTAAFGTRLSKDLGAVDGAIGSVEVMESAICEKTSGRCTHEVIKEE